MAFFVNLKASFYSSIFFIFNLPLTSYLYHLHHSEALIWGLYSYPVGPVNGDIAACCRTYRAPADRIQTSSAATESHLEPFPPCHHRSKSLVPEASGSALGSSNFSWHVELLFALQRVRPFTHGAFSVFGLAGSVLPRVRRVRSDVLRMHSGISRRSALFVWVYRCWWQCRSVVVVSWCGAGDLTRSCGRPCWDTRDGRQVTSCVSDTHILIQHRCENVVPWILFSGTWRGNRVIGIAYERSACGFSTSLMEHLESSLATSLILGLALPEYSTEGLQPLTCFRSLHD